MDFSANLSLPYLLPNQAQKHVTLNESLRVLDAKADLERLRLGDEPAVVEPSQRVARAEWQWHCGVAL